MLFKFSAPDKQARLFGEDNLHVTFEALRERRSNVLGRRNSVSDRRKIQMETLKGPISPLPGINHEVPASGASRARGKPPKPSVSSIDFTNQVLERELPYYHTILILYQI